MASSAYEIPNLRFSGVSGGTIFRRRFVKIDADGNVVQASANTDYIVGASSQPANLNEVAEIYDGIVIVEAGAAITLLEGGTPVMSDANGKAVPFDSEDTDAVIAGVALTAASGDGVHISVKI